MRPNGALAPSTSPGGLAEGHSTCPRGAWGLRPPRHGVWPQRRACIATSRSRRSPGGRQMRPNGPEPGSARGGCRGGRARGGAALAGAARGAGGTRGAGGGEQRRAREERRGAARSEVAGRRQGACEGAICSAVGRGGAAAGASPGASSDATRTQLTQLQLLLRRAPTSRCAPIGARLFHAGGHMAADVSHFLAAAGACCRHPGGVGMSEDNDRARARGGTRRGLRDGTHARSKS